LRKCELLCLPPTTDRLYSHISESCMMIGLAINIIRFICKPLKPIKHGKQSLSVFAFSLCYPMKLYMCQTNIIIDLESLTGMDYIFVVRVALYSSMYNNPMSYFCNDPLEMIITVSHKMHKAGLGDQIIKKC
jgi:hypothetical protein